MFVLVGVGFLIAVCKLVCICVYVCKCVCAHRHTHNQTKSPFQSCFQRKLSFLPIINLKKAGIDRQKEKKIDRHISYPLFPLNCSVSVLFSILPSSFPVFSAQHLCLYECVCVWLMFLACQCNRASVINRACWS